MEKIGLKCNAWEIECCECNKWRVLYSKSKLSSFKIATLERYLDTIQYTCGDSFEALANLSIEMENVGYENSESDDIGIFLKINPMEVPSGVFEDICFQCGK
ncbi:unnamed protein product [Rhizophagus irregularis]|nr:hypothetical protein RhiirC2_793743 [Rhizophagus irregularis]CAB4373482.1 unnamed protein product [Rhizophagus irregularis]CAB5356997.1 unnamed protein product [Rhizophagus irregularis]